MARRNRTKAAHKKKERGEALYGYPIHEAPSRLSYCTAVWTMDTKSSVILVAYGIPDCLRRTSFVPSWRTLRFFVPYNKHISFVGVLGYNVVAVDGYFFASKEEKKKKKKSSARVIQQASKQGPHTPPITSYHVIQLAVMWDGSPSR